ncbi:MAG: choline dehydrogenase [Alphaproteobacteria bacterium]|nr:MAG: choline dehydrogenase [Alphaproteobacteria bacterium]
MGKVNLEEFDYVIIGAGSAGSIVVSRLAEQENVTVCVLEAGPSDLRPYIYIPAGFVKTLKQEKITWQFKTEPTEHTGGRSIDTTQGRVVGGSGSINGMVYNRGLPSDFDRWAEMGNQGWGYNDILKYFIKSENRIGNGIDGIRGRGKGIPVTDMDWFHPVSEEFIKAAQDAGMPLNPDYNSGQQEGVGYFQRTIKNGLRVSSAAAFLRPALKKSNVKLITSATATSLVFDGKRVVGVQYIRGRQNKTHEIRARREVILCSGTVNTARLLQVSGIGPKSLLDNIGVPCVHELSGVGENLADHYSARIVMRAKRGVVTLNEMAKGPRLAIQMMKWVLQRPNILSHAPSQVYMFCKSQKDLELPDLQCVFTPGSYKEGEHYMLDDYPGVTGGAWQHRPKSTGYVRAISRHISDAPLIQPNYLKDPTDQAVMVAGMQFVRKILHMPRLKEYLDLETVPGSDVFTDDEMLQFCEENGSTGYHLVGTARMGPASDKTAVVDDKLCVYGIQGLRVADASIMPTIPSANTYASSLMIGEKAADLIKEAARNG